MRLLTSLLARTRAGLLLVLGGLLFVAAPSAAQQGSGTVTGTVTQSGSGQPLAGVLVSVTGTTSKSVTNTRGVYTLERAPTGAQTLVFRWLGYRPTEVPATIAATGNTTVNATMSSFRSSCPS